MPNMIEKCFHTDVLLACSDSACQHHEIILQANIMVEQGLRVLVAETGQRGQPEGDAFLPEVVRLAAPSSSTKTNSKNIWVRWRRSFAYEQHLKDLIRQYHPKVIIAYDVDSMAALSAVIRSGDAKVVFTFSELLDRRIKTSLFRHWKIWRVQQLSRSVDLHIHQDPYRAAIFRADTNCTIKSVIVPNCPRLIEKISASPFKSEVEAKLGRACRIIVYVGGIDPDRKLLEIVESIPYWPSDALLICSGLVVPRFAGQLQRRAQELGVGQRLVIEQAKTYGKDDDIISRLATAELGLDLRAKKDLNSIYSAFATNKLHQYMAAGLPVIARCAPGYIELVQLAETGICVDMDSPEQIAKAVNTILGNQELQRRYGANGRRLHLNWFNHEWQFVPVLSQILEWCGREPL